MCNSLASLAAMTETIQAKVGDTRFSVRLRSPSAKEAYWTLSRRKSQAETINNALTTVASRTDPNIDDPQLALNWLMDKWDTSKSVTVREALRRAAMEVEVDA